MAEKKNIGNEDIVRFLWQALNYPETLDKDFVLDDTNYGDAKKARTYSEFWNHVSNKAKENPEYLIPVLESLSAYTDTDVPETAWSQEAAKQRDLNIENLGIGDVDSMSQALALALGYSDNDTKNGALKAMLADTYGKNNPMNNAGRKKLNELIYGKLNDPESRDKFLSSLDFSPYSDDDYVYDELMKRVLRSQRASNYENRNGVAKFLEGLARPQASKKFSEGIEPNTTDNAADALTLGILMATKNPVLAGLVGVGGDIVHDAIDESNKVKEYEYGQNERSENGDWTESIDTPEHRQNALLSLLFAGGGRLAGKGYGAARNNRLLGPVIEKAEDLVGKGSEKVLSLFGKGKAKKEAANLKRSITRDERKLDDLYKDYDLNDAETKIIESGKAFKSEDDAVRILGEKTGKQRALKKEIGELEAEIERKRKLLDNPETPSMKVAEMLKRGASGVKNAATGRMYDPNFYAVEAFKNIFAMPRDNK